MLAAMRGALNLAVLSEHRICRHNQPVQHSASAISSRLSSNGWRSNSPSSHVDELARSIAALSREDQDFLLGWIRRIATTNIQIAHQFALRAISCSLSMDTAHDRCMGIAHHGYL